MAVLPSNTRRLLYDHIAGIYRILVAAPEKLITCRLL